MQEGWDLDDDLIRLAIINTTNKSEKIQSLDRIRKDIDILIYKTYDEIKYNELIVPEDFLNVILTPEDKDKLCKIIGWKDKNGRLLKWRTIQKGIVYNGYTIENKQLSYEGKRVRTSIIKRNE